MENRRDLASIIPFLPVVVRSSSLLWPPQVVERLKDLSRGPDHSGVDSGELLFLAILRIGSSLPPHVDSSVAFGFALFFDDLLPPDESRKWFREVVPAMANLVLRLPSLLETHYQNADSIVSGVETGLRLLGSQEPGIVFLNQELIGALLACSFFCLFPMQNRYCKDLPTINFDKLFENLYECYDEKQENKIKCIIHYFERICSSVPAGFVSFERKILPLEHHLHGVSYPKADFWSKSVGSLCRFEVYNSGLLEDHFGEALEVDFANRYIGGGALRRGCVQEEIRFMINPELIAGMLFLPAMADNEAIEIVGVERFSNYTGYASSFRFSGDHVDKRVVDSLGRRKTRIIAIDALCCPRMRQFELECLLRDVNKAFCGFLDLSKYQQWQKWLENDGPCRSQADQDVEGDNSMSTSCSLIETSSTSTETNKRISGDLYKISEGKDRQYPDIQEDVGIVTGNWGCGAFGGDPEVKVTIQWLAASQALRPFISYYTFGMEQLQTLDRVFFFHLLVCALFSIVNHLLNPK